MIDKVKVGKELYPINTDFRVGLRCNEVAQDESIGNVERVMAVIYILYGDKGLEDTHNHARLYELAIKYLNRGEALKQQGKPNMDFTQDEQYIYSSFMGEYKINLDDIDYLHWYRFLDLLNGLTDTAVLNRVRGIRDIDLSEITDRKQKQKAIEAMKSVELKKKISKEKQSELDEFNKLIGVI